MALTDNIVSYWKLDESSGNAEDAVSTNDLTNNNSTPFVAAKINNGGDFETSSAQSFTIADASQSGLDLTGTLSVSCWIYAESLPANDACYGIVNKFTTGATPGGYVIEFGQYNVGTYHITLAYRNASTSNWRQFNYAFSTGTWYHIVGVIAPSATAADSKVYVNGSAVTISGSSGASTSTSNGDAAFGIGSASGRGGFATNSTFDGFLDEVGIWSRALTADEVTELYNGGDGLQYPFTGEPPATAVKDIISSGIIAFAR